MKTILIFLFIVSLAVILSATTRVIDLSNTNPNAWGIFVRGIGVCFYSIIAVAIIRWAIAPKEKKETE
jgi:divalent metal cation (Fe/Co/Zn/Cd) transporter